MLPHKRGDSFDRLTNIPEAFSDGYFVGWTVTAQIRTARYGEVIADLVCAWVDPATTRILSIKCLDTKPWPVGPAEMDVQFVRTSDGYTMSTSTLQFNIVRDVTRAIS
ncbi:hypothetical protein phiK7A1_060 [Pseudomonas phage phiK7A1]|uniref:Uncharacterized protein n=1 Tax=Pseudomonas phage phiK7A1 TaxID=2759194 RepID=A0A7H0XFQ8_9CAUD|nr:hypothetical protein phiK7A1_060 [Pseudomonas phage phiK7A1]